MGALLKEVKEANQDYEWYPTTQEIINEVILDLGNNFSDSMLDIGAGDGRVLKALQKSKASIDELYAIEKSIPLIKNMPSDIMIIGTDFFEQTLLDKKVGAIFCNPPYSEHSEWVKKIITEANTNKIYLVIPHRWQADKSIADIIEKSPFKMTVLGTFDFKNAERQARAIVNLVRLEKSIYSDNNAFSNWFNDVFLDGAETLDTKELFDSDEAKNKERLEEVNKALVKGGNLIETFANMYSIEMKELMDAYSSINTINPILLQSIDIRIDNLIDALKSKISGLKFYYWNELFNRYQEITSRLTSKSRGTMIRKLETHVNVDFSVGNAYAITIWAIKQANYFFDSQLVEVFTDLLDSSNVVLYKSNKKTFSNDYWRFTNEIKETGKIGLDYRIVTTCYDNFSGYGRDNGLGRSATNKLNDLCTIAENLGYRVIDRVDSFYWEAGKPKEFIASISGQELVLMRVKGFKNGNVHIQFNKEFIKRLNVEMGRLKGWLKSKEQAQEELDLTSDEVEMYFNNNLCFPLSSNILRLNSF